MNPSVPITFAEIQAKCTPDKIGYLIGANPRRLGGKAFMVFLEYQHFVPDTPANADYELFQMEWLWSTWILVLIPKDKAPLADALMVELGLRASDGIPHLIDHTGVHPFPVHGDNLFTIENVPGSPVYKNDPAATESAYDAEDEACEKVFKDFEKAHK